MNLGLQLQKSQYLQLGPSRGQYYGGSLPNVNQIGSGTMDLPFQVSVPPPALPRLRGASPQPPTGDQTLQTAGVTRQLPEPTPPVPSPFLSWELEEAEWPHQDAPGSPPARSPSADPDAGPPSGLQHFGSHYTCPPGGHTYSMAEKTTSDTAMATARLDGAEPSPVSPTSSTPTCTTAGQGRGPSAGPKGQLPGIY
ncbi:hypothetical protein P7K49_033667 [Saguinus oedipus]|uniref:Uncharacterized protein n=1 Tax=Saguinus oedipus TaxID=9490 RepID=A0ABQ9TTB2_SAGOE|nr:hypothetical protein P7K49_033667 [Saguinus oedipus]